MRSAQYRPGPDRTAQILQKSTIVSRALARHRLEANFQGKTEEAREMETSSSGVSRMILEFSQPHQQSNAA
jgi:hypothetical protein